MPLLGILALLQIIDAGAEAWKKYGKAMAAGFGIPAAVSLAAVVAPGIFGGVFTENDRYTTEMIQKQVAEYATQNGYPESQIAQAVYPYSLAYPANKEAITALRHGLVRDDGLRSLLFLALAFGTILLYISRKVDRKSTRLNSSHWS